MPKNNSKQKKLEFLKKYADSIGNVSGKGVWSGRSIGIPVMGAVDGSSDGSKYLGRPPRPRYSRDTGSPSQYADSGFSSFLSRVNKNFEAEDFPPMFPDQEEGYYDDLADIYRQYDVKPLVTDKLPKQLPSRLSSKMTEDQEINENIASDLAMKEFGNVTGDAFRQAVSGFDGIDWAVLIPSLMKNYAELRYGIYASNKKLRSYREKPDQSAAEDLAMLSTGLAIDVMDIIQILAEIVVPSFSGTALSISLDRTLSKFPLVKQALVGGGRTVQIARGTISRNILKDLSRDIEESMEGLPGFAQQFLRTVIQSLEKISEIEEILERREGIEDIYTYSGDEETIASKIKKLPSYLQGFASDFIEDLATKPIEKFLSLTEDSYNNEGIKMNKHELRELIEEVLQEYVVSQPASLHVSQPGEYLFRDPPEVDIEGNLIPADGKTYDDYAVIVSADDGVITYGPRVNEDKVRSLVRSIISEDKKKVKKKTTKTT